MSTLSKKIDKLELDEMSPKQIERTVKALSPEGMTMRKERKDIRYQLYRMATEATGGPAADVNKDLIKKYEKDPLFAGWRFFGIIWDISQTPPYECVHRDKSVLGEWEDVVKAKFPQVEPGGKVTYPDINVRKKVEAHQKKRGK